MAAMGDPRQGILLRQRGRELAVIACADHNGYCAEIDEALLTKEEQLPEKRRKLPQLGRTGEEIRRRVSSLQPIAEKDESSYAEAQSLRSRLRSM